MSLSLELTVFNKLFASVAEEMGIVLRQSAFSPNIRERRDYSAAVFTGQGELLAQAAHIPVHLGALPLTMARVLAEFPPLGPGDILMLNDPYWGGTHLPDITLMAPYFDDNAGLLWYVVNRAHHADVGGDLPASMPLAEDVRQEGVIIGPTLLARGGVVDEAFLNGLLARMRAPRERRGDLAAQVGALGRGQLRLADLCQRYGPGRLQEMSAALLDYSQRAMCALIRQIPNGVYQVTDVLDDDGYGNEDLPITVTLTVQDEAAVLDFRDSAPQTRGGVNTVPAVVEAACYYVFLALLAEDYPINQGCFRPLQVLTRPGSLLAARYPAPVAAGNVETSQRLVDVVLGALAQALPNTIPAASQGTMNNLAFGGQHPDGRDFTYYETIAGGMGGGPGHPGLDGVHTHMTNTRNTPVEVLEQEYPLRIENYGFRGDGGGRGRFPGGRGLERVFQFLAPVSLSLLTERRRREPYGLAGGSPGQPGENRLLTPEGEVILPAKANLNLPAGSRVIIRTPGGGGWGKVEKRD